MDAKTFVIFIVIVAVMITMLVQFSVRGRCLSPRIRRLLWASLTAGIMALIAGVAVTVFE